MKTVTELVRVLNELPADGLDGVAERVLAFAAGSPSLAISGVYEEGLPLGRRPLVITAPEPARVEADAFGARLFRQLLAFLSGKAKWENGGDPNPYGDRIWFDRLTPGGPVRLEVEFWNTPARQEIRAVRVPAPLPIPAAPPATAVEPAPTPQPAG